MAEGLWDKLIIIIMYSGILEFVFSADQVLNCFCGQCSQINSLTTTGSHQMDFVKLIYSYYFLSVNIFNCFIGPKST